MLGGDKGRGKMSFSWHIAASRCNSREFSRVIDIGSDYFLHAFSPSEISDTVTYHNTITTWTLLRYLLAHRQCFFCPLVI
jgi:hypothetical protein